jgi:hypothetical protein
MSSTIRITYNINDQTWNFQENELKPVVFTDLEFSFTSKETMTQYKNLEFGLSLQHKESLLLSDQFPKNDTVYECSDSYPLACVSIDLIAEEEYILKVWASNDDIRSESEYIFVTPKTEQPFNSWIWNKETKDWDPPIIRPEGHVRWKDDTKEWVPVQPGETVW